MEQETYKKFMINFDRGKDCFVAFEEGEEVHRDISLRNLKLWIDDYCKKEFKRTEVYELTSNNEITIGTITSFNSQEKEIWVTSSDKNRQKHSLRYSCNLYLKTPENKRVLEEIVKLKWEQERLEKKIEKTENSLSSITYKEMCKITGEKAIDD